MVDAVEKAGVANTVWYNYRRIPAVTLAKQIVDSGKLGQIFHYRANFLQDWTISADLPQGGEGLWRLDAAAAVHREEHDSLVVDVSHVLERLGEGRGGWQGRGAKVVLEIAGSRAAAGRGCPWGRARLGHDARRGRAGDESGRLPSRVWSV